MTLNRKHVCNLCEKVVHIMCSVPVTDEDNIQTCLLKCLGKESSTNEEKEEEANHVKKQAKMMKKIKQQIVTRRMMSCLYQ
jgi:hypothetical protein